MRRACPPSRSTWRRCWPARAPGSRWNSTSTRPGSSSTPRPSQAARCTPRCPARTVRLINTWLAGPGTSSLSWVSPSPRRRPRCGWEGGCGRETTARSEIRIKGMRVRPISPELLVDELASRVAEMPRDRWLRVAIDGAPPARPGDLGDALVGPLRALGRDATRVSARDFLRPASVRYEFGRYDPDVFYDDTLDTGGLIREVLAPLEAGGAGLVL